MRRASETVPETVSETKWRLVINYHFSVAWFWRDLMMRREHWCVEIVFRQLPSRSAYEHFKHSFSVLGRTLYTGHAHSRGPNNISTRAYIMGSYCTVGWFTLEAPSVIENSSCKSACKIGENQKDSNSLFVVKAAWRPLKMISWVSNVDHRQALPCMFGISKVAISVITCISTGAEYRYSIITLNDFDFRIHPCKSEINTALNWRYAIRLATPQPYVAAESLRLVPLIKRTSSIWL